MNAKQIKQAINNGKRVFWHHAGYEVIKDNIGQYLIKCHINGHYSGLTDKEGKLMEDPNHFYIAGRLWYDYDIEGYYHPHGWEVVHTVETIKEARQALKDYQANQPGTYRIKKVKIEGND